MLKMLVIFWVTLPLLTAMANPGNRLSIRDLKGFLLNPTPAYFGAEQWFEELRRNSEERQYYNQLITKSWWLRNAADFGNSQIQRIKDQLKTDFDIHSTIHDSPLLQPNIYIAQSLKLLLMQLGDFAFQDVDLFTRDDLAMSKARHLYSVPSEGDVKYSPDYVRANLGWQLLRKEVPMTYLPKNSAQETTRKLNAWKQKTLQSLYTLKRKIFISTIRIISQFQPQRRVFYFLTRDHKNKKEIPLIELKDFAKGWVLVPASRPKVSFFERKLYRLSNALSLSLPYTYQSFLEKNKTHYYNNENLIDIESLFSHNRRLNEQTNFLYNFRNYYRQLPTWAAGYLLFLIRASDQIEKSIEILYSQPLINLQQAKKISIELDKEIKQVQRIKEPNYSPRLHRSHTELLLSGDWDWPANDSVSGLKWSKFMSYDGHWKDRDFIASQNRKPPYWEASRKNTNQTQNSSWDTSKAWNDFLERKKIELYDVERFSPTAEKTIFFARRDLSPSSGISPLGKTENIFFTKTNLVTDIKIKRRSAEKISKTFNKLYIPTPHNSSITLLNVYLSNKKLLMFEKHYRLAIDIYSRDYEIEFLIENIQRDFDDSIPEITIEAGFHLHTPLEEPKIYFPRAQIKHIQGLASGYRLEKLSQGLMEAINSEDLSSISIAKTFAENGQYSFRPPSHEGYTGYIHNHEFYSVCGPYNEFFADLIKNYSVRYGGIRAHTQTGFLLSAQASVITAAHFHKRSMLYDYDKRVSAPADVTPTSGPDAERVAAALNNFESSSSPSGKDRGFLKTSLAAILGGSLAAAAAVALPSQVNFTVPNTLLEKLLKQDWFIEPRRKLSKNESEDGDKEELKPEAKIEEVVEASTKLIAQTLFESETLDKLKKLKGDILEWIKLNKINWNPQFSHTSLIRFMELSQKLESYLREFSNTQGLPVLTAEDWETIKTSALSFSSLLDNPSDIFTPEAVLSPVKFREFWMQELAFLEKKGILQKHPALSQLFDEEVMKKAETLVSFLLSTDWQIERELHLETCAQALTNQPAHSPNPESP